jgi:uncharacterized protein YccT (UPF0319 family)
MLSALIKVNKNNEKPMHINSAGLMHVELIDCEDNQVNVIQDHLEKIGLQKGNQFIV